MARFELKRRTVIRGMGTIGVALPALEIMAPARRALAAAPPKRYLLGYSGFSTGTSLQPAVASPWWPTRDMVAPDNTGPTYRPTLGMQAAFDQGVTGDFGIVSGLKVPWGNSGSLPPGGRIVGFHGTGVYPQVTGLRSNVGLVASGPSADQIVARTIYADAPVPPKYKALLYCVEASGPDGTSLSFRDRGEPITPVASPKVAYAQLFDNFTPVDSTPRLAVTELLRRKSVVDLVLGKAKSLLPRLGTADRLRMQDHFDQIVDLERRIKQAPPMAGIMCKAPAPVTDPPKANDYGEINPNSGAPSISGYGSEEERAEMIFGFIRMAFICDLSRVVSVVFLPVQSGLDLRPLIGVQSEPHHLTHTYDPVANPVAIAGLGKLVGWHVKHLANLVKALWDTPETDGSSMLDNFALAMLFEGGHGFDPEGSLALTPEAADPANLSFQAHSSENMSVIVAGRAGGLRSGQHIRFNNNRHPAEVVLATMRAVGYDGPLGDFGTPLPELFKVGA